ncbi:hypothetical protein SAMN06265379_101897 [Saccharicrinis carchari]|uniref:NfeD-like C-terminal, partner-binding n=1 Tax=Saccharicrinis carchari TaxID=1168039 RepID=A0A521BE85_SACCC|nr:hypothetical protein [Saccharicrinis carchari]SMO45417.1 hypothetical protein SAMN06265379_101897 [Saccharicrinis carchari]
MDRLLYLYIATGVFGIGVILVDFFTNAISSFQADGGDGDGADDGDDGDDGDDTEGDHDTRISDVLHTSGRAQDMELSEHEDGSYIVDYKKHKSSIILEFISWLRTLVYFAAGFGIIGTFAILTGESRISSLLWSIPVGIVTVLIFKIFKHIQNKKLDSSFRERELLNLPGEALLPITGSSMGKVRITFGSVTLERYAKLASADSPVKKGDKVVICNVDKDVVYIQKQ